MPNGTAQSFGVLNYTGALFNKGNTATPLTSIIGSRAAATDHVEFAVGQEYDTGNTAAQPEISETASLTAPDPSYETRVQRTNVTQIFQRTVAVSYGKMSNMGTLAGLNVSGQSANPANELDFQTGVMLQKLKNDVEYTFINGVYQKATTDAEANKTRGLVSAITTNVKPMAGQPMSYWAVCQMLEQMGNNNTPIDNLVLWMDSTTRLQLNADASQNGLTIVDNSREINGINISKLTTGLGDIGLYTGRFLPAGTCLVLNLNAIRPVIQPVPGKGNFFLEPLAKTGASEKYQLFGQIGLDHGLEWLHGKFTGLATTFTPPAYSRSVYVVNND